MFPENWLQTWYHMPDSASIDPQLLTWWNISETTRPLGFDEITLASDILTVQNGALWPLLNSFFPDDTPYVKSYLNWTDPVSLVLFEQLPFFNSLPTIAATQCVVVRRFDSTAFGYNRAMFRLSGVQQAHVEGGYLTSAALTLFESAASALAQPVISQGVTFTPAICSFKNNSLTNIIRHQVNRKLGVLRRRRKQWAYSTWNRFAPKPPP